MGIFEICKNWTGKGWNILQEILRLKLILEPKKKKKKKGH
jgi:hypothetical protein